MFGREQPEQPDRKWLLEAELAGYATRIPDAAPDAKPGILAARDTALDRLWGMLTPARQAELRDQASQVLGWPMP